MGFLNLFGKKRSGLVRLPAGSFTVDRTGLVVASTLPQSFPEDWVKAITRCVLQAFRGAHSAQLPLHQIVVHYPALKITAREMRGGAMIFLAPRVTSNEPQSNHH